MNNIGLITRRPIRSLPLMWKISPDEPYFIRRFKPTHKRDLETVMLMDLQPNVQDMPDAKDETGQEIEYDEMLSFKDEFKQDRKLNNSIFAVTDHASRAIGWVWYYADATSPIPKKAIQHLSLPQDTHYLEISYQKLGTKIPTEALRQSRTLTHQFVRRERKGVAISGVRQTLHYLRQQAADKSVLVFAYVDIANIASAKVLERNNFTRYDKKYRDGQSYQYFWYKVI